MWNAALTTFADLNQPTELRSMENSSEFVDHLDADRANNAVIIGREGDVPIAVWTAADGESYASAELPLEDPNDAETTPRDMGKVVNVWF